MIEIHIEPFGKAVSDWEVEQLVKDIIYPPNDYYSYSQPLPVYRFSNMLVLDYFRAEIVEDPYQFSKFKFFIDGEEIPFNDYMVANNFRHPVWEQSLNISGRILRAADKRLDAEERKAKEAKQIQLFKEKGLTLEELTRLVVKEHYNKEKPNLIEVLKIIREASGEGLKASKEALDKELIHVRSQEVSGKES